MHTVVVPLSHRAAGADRLATATGRRALAAVLACAALTGAACSSDDGGDTSSGSSAGTATPDSAADPASPSSSATTTTTTVAPSTTTTTLVATTSTTVIPTVPETGVPGIASGDDFCRAWSEFAGTFQALALASNLAADPAAARRAEVAAAPAVVAAVGDMDTALPAVLEPERDVLLADLVGPFGRRAERALDELVQAGMSADQTDALGDLWLATLAERGLDDPDITVDAPADVDPLLTAAVAVFSAEVPPISQDPSLVTAAQAPSTEQYLSDNCPDQGTLAGNDVVDG